ncbi:MAG: nucleotidyl transferase AbiEii/AbiGii toxin family protein [Anaerolineales bacterium]
MKVPKDFASLIKPLIALQGLLTRFGDQGVIIGGIASGFLGKPRMTVDLDAMFLASFADIPRIIELARAEGIEPRAQNMVEFAHKSRVLLMRHTESGANIDISLGVLAFEEEMVERSIEYKVASFSVRLPTPEDLIIMKAVAHRPKDLEDIRNIAVKHPKLDTARIEQYVKAFAEILELPDLWGQISKLLKG